MEEIFQEVRKGRKGKNGKAQGKVVLMTEPVAKVEEARTKRKGNGRSQQKEKSS